MLQIGQLIVDQLLEKEEQKLVMIATISQILGEILPHSLSDTELLSVDERLNGDTNCHINIALIDVLPQVHSSMSLGYTDNRFDVSDRDWDASGDHRFATQLGVHVRDLVLVHVVEARVDLLFRVDDVLLEEVLWNDVNAECVRDDCRRGGGRRVH